MRNTRPFLVMALTALIATMLVAPAAAKGGPPSGAGPNPVYEIDDERINGVILALEAPPGTTPISTGQEVLRGEIDGAAWLGQIPENWNGGLVVHAHGYRGEGTSLYVDPAPQAKFLLDEGYAWVASSYRRNSYDPGIGVIDTKNATVAFEELLENVTGESVEHTYLVGFSMGGHVTGAAIEKYPNLYDGAMPMCGVMGDVELFDYFLDYNLGAAALAGVKVSYPDREWLDQEVPAIREELSGAPDDFFFANLTAASPPFVVTNTWASTGLLGGALGLSLIDPRFGDNLEPLGRDFKDFVEIGSGGDRATFDLAWDFWHLLAAQDGDFFFDLGEGDGTIANRGGVVGQNVDTIYADEYGDAFAGFDAEGGIERVEAANRVRKANGTKPAPIIEGTPSVPVLSLHTTGDLFVPIEQLQIYAQEVADNGRGDLLVTRAIRDVGHCSFTGQEIEAGYSDLFAWVEGGVPAEGENILPGKDGEGIHDPNVGCAFTTGSGGNATPFRALLESC